MVILPAIGQFETLQANFSPDWLAQALDARQFQMMHLSLPKFNFDSDFSLVNALSTLGMPNKTRRKFPAKIYLLFIPFLCNFVLK
ncbi:MAG: serpin family protein [Anaerolineales bacterium]